MFKGFWFYFNFIPALFTVLFFSLTFVVAKTGPKPVFLLFSDAVAHCQDVSNDRWADDERTYQDKCIDEFMNGKEEFSTYEEIWVWGFILSLLGIVFIIPLSIYLLLTWRMHRYGHY